ncbi:hypothetical protein TSAR_011167 [Trichomalopsis sarcophagae]|uniref:HAT C-terminal dimerisation domain-containing protein n=1 Tax=Trichomalopsis sarcophagae TaxID=543379 RepID=A0A232EPV8_9HYME|nr:hypothetical protein TSAR_011167 [Trichomalopsis sarcophagae]
MEGMEHSIPQVFQAESGMPASFKRWKKTHTWLMPKSGKVFCSFCTDAITNKFPLVENRSCQISKEAFVTVGFNCWKNAAQTFKSHESSELHSAATEFVLNKNKPNIVDIIQESNEKEKLEARIVLRAIFTTASYLARQGLSFRRENAKESNFYKLLELRSHDIPELKAWLNRKKYEHSWLHHTIINEILSMMADEIKEDILKEIKENKYFSIMIDETSDIKRLEQRLGRFHDLQSEKSPDLTPFCPTRWTMRISSLKRLYHDANYQSVIDFMLLTSNARDTDAITSSKAKGFSKHLQTFETYFLLTTMINIFEAIELLNTQLQKSQLCLNESNKLVEISTKNLETQRDQKFEVIWKEANKGIAKFNVEEPSVRRERKTPRRFDSSSEAHIFDTPEDNYRKIYFEVYDKVLMSLNTRFETETINLLSKFENFLIGKNNINVLDITNFYNTQKKNESKEDNFDAQLLTNQRDLFLNYAKNNNVQLESVKDVVAFLKSEKSYRLIFNEYTKLVRLLLTIPGSTCTNERSFSTLRFLKTYTRATMGQDRLNHYAILYVYRDRVEALNIGDLMNKFILKNQHRKNTFAIIKQ